MRDYGKGKFEFKKDGCKRSIPNKNRDIFIQLEKPEPTETSDSEIEFTPPEPLSDITTDKHLYTLITTEREFMTLCERLKSAKEFVFDTETTSTDPLNAELVGISFALKSHEAFYVPVSATERQDQAGLFGDNEEQSLFTSRLTRRAGNRDHLD